MPRIILFCLCALFSGPLLSAADEPIDVGDNAPAFAASDASGRIVEFPQVAAGRPVVLLFWATWCPYCKALMPHLDELRTKYREQGVKVLALNIKEDADPAAHLLEKGYDFTLLLEADGVAERYGVRFTPGLFVVDGAGRVLFRRRPSGGKKPSEIVGLWARQADAAVQQALVASPTVEGSQR